LAQIEKDDKMKNMVVGKQNWIVTA
jgi:hypothetical protein